MYDRSRRLWPFDSILLYIDHDSHAEGTTIESGNSLLVELDEKPFIDVSSIFEGDNGDLLSQQGDGNLHIACKCKTCH